MDASRRIEADDLEDIAIGGAVLGTGGGGDPYIGKLMAQRAIRRRGAVTLINVEQVPDDALVVPVCMMGAPTVMTEKLPQGEEIVVAFSKLERLLGRRIDAVLCCEAGGLNSTTPFIVAAETGRPLIDGDGMGRAYPELQMVTFTLHGVAATPMVLADDKGNSVVLETIDNKWTERLARSCTIDMGGSALLAFYPMSGGVAKRAVVRGTLGLAAALGRTLRESRAAHADPVAAVAGKLAAQHVFDGRVADVERRTVGGFARGAALFDGLEAARGHRFRIAFQNEFLVIERDGAALATTPDLIILLDRDTGAPVTTESLKFGLRVACIVAPGPAQWRTPAGLDLIGPRYFGYDIDYHPFAPA